MASRAWFESFEKSVIDFCRPTERNSSLLMRRRAAFSIPA
jgi:hypothetical protein